MCIYLFVCPFSLVFCNAFGYCRDDNSTINEMSYTSPYLVSCLAFCALSVYTIFQDNHNGSVRPSLKWNGDISSWMSCANLLYLMRRRVFRIRSFILRKMQLHAGIASLFRRFLVSYWSSQWVNLSCKQCRGVSFLCKSHFKIHMDKSVTGKIFIVFQDAKIAVWFFFVF